MFLKFNKLTVTLYIEWFLSLELYEIKSASSVSDFRQFDNEDGNKNRNIGKRQKMPNMETMNKVEDLQRNCVDRV